MVKLLNKMIGFNGVSVKDKDDNIVLQHYIDFYEQCDEKTDKQEKDLILFQNRLFKNENKLQKAANQIEIDLQKEEEQKELSEALITKVLDDDLQHLADSDKFIVKSKKDFIYREMTIRGIYRQYGIIFNKFGPPTLDEILKTDGRNHQYAIYSFDKNLPDGVFNKMKMDEWIQPIAGECHPIFDILMTSLAGGNIDAKQHIEQCVIHKFAHPECYQIPCFLSYGDGGVGFDLFVKKLLPTIFKGSRISSLRDSMVVGTFQDRLEGSVVVALEEMRGMTKNDMNAFKSLVGNPDISVNSKNVKHNVVESTAWFMGSANDFNAGVVLDGGASDRRWSLIKKGHNIILHYMASLGIDITQYKTMTISEMNNVFEFTKALKEWMNMEKILKNTEQVSIWMNYIIKKHGISNNPPKAYQNEEFNDLQESQRKLCVKLFILIIEHSEFKQIALKDFYEMYIGYAKKFGTTHEKNNGLTSLDEVKKLISRYLEKNNTDIEFFDSKNEKRYKQIPGTNSRKRFNGWLLKNETPLESRMDTFMIIDNFGNVMLDTDFIENGEKRQTYIELVK